MNAPVTLSPELRPFIMAHKGFVATRDGVAPHWLQELRRLSIDRFAAQGFPTPRMESWKYTDISPFLQSAYAVNPPPLEMPDLQTLEARLRPMLNGPRLVFVNGIYVEALSAPGPAEGRIVLRGLSEQVARQPESVQADLQYFVPAAEHGLLALNNAYLDQGAYLQIPNGTEFEQPIQLLFVTTAGGAEARAMTQLRNLIWVGRDCQVDLIAQHVALDETPAFNNLVNQIQVGANSVVTLYRLQEEGPETLHLTHTLIQQARDSRVRLGEFGFGARVARHSLQVLLSESGAECELDGLYLASGRQHLDHHIRVEHRHPRCTSAQDYRGILQGRGHGIFTGRVLVEKDAQQSNARQHNANLLLSDKAEATTRPQLEILADDVKCSHGATVGRLDETALYYLRSRGLEEETARNLLIYAFAARLIEAVKMGPVREHLRRALLARLPGGPEMEELLR